MTAYRLRIFFRTGPLWLTVGSSCLAQTSTPAANPARPTITIPAQLPPAGYLQFEQGWYRADESPGGTASQVALSQTTKIALNSRIVVQMLSQPYAYSSVTTSATTAASNDPGDLQVGVQGVLRQVAGLRPTVSLGYIRRVRAGTSANLDAGGYSQALLLLVGGDVAGFHYDGNALLTEQNNGPVRHGQTGQTLAISHPLFPVATKNKLGATVEISHFTQPFTTDTYSGRSASRANTLDLLLVGTYTPRPNLVVDWSFDHGFTSTSTQWQGGFGVTYLLPHRLWPDRHAVAPAGDLKP